MNTDLTGMQFANLTVLEPIAHESKWLCRCSCGTMTVARSFDLQNGKKKSCGCLRRRRHGSDIAGMRSGRLVAVEPTDMKRRNATLWRCRCDCGNEFLTEAYKIRSQTVSSCGCGRKQKNMREIAGQRFGNLVALERLNEKRGSNYLWLCQCDCGNQKKATANALLFGTCKSCGCIKKATLQEIVKRCGTVKDHVRLIDGTSVDLIEKKGLRRNNTSGYTGVQAKGNKWIAVITFKKKVYYLGSFSDINDAIRARKAAEDQLFGEFLDWYYQNCPERKKKSPQPDECAQAPAGGAVPGTDA